MPPFKSVSFTIKIFINVLASLWPIDFRECFVLGLLVSRAFGVIGLSGVGAWSHILDQKLKIFSAPEIIVVESVYHIHLWG